MPAPHILQPHAGNSLFISTSNLQGLGPTGISTTDIESNTNAVLTMVQTLSFISCSGQTGTLNPWAYIGGPTDIVSGTPITFTVGPYATTIQTTVFTQTYPTVTLETVQPSVLVWNVSPYLRRADFRVQLFSLLATWTRDWYEHIADQLM